VLIFWADFMAKAIYAGSFDPITNGHLWVIDKSAAIFDELVVAIGENADKRYTFSREERLMLLESCLSQYSNIKMGYFSGEFLVNYAKRIGATHIVRGIRNSQDYEYEKTMRYINSDLCSDIDTVFLMPPRNYAEVSSSLIKGLVGSNGWEDIVTKYVPKEALDALIKISSEDYHVK
jgi:pantetheine-phosphate adenylyltransferase